MKNFDLSFWLQRFFREYLVEQRNVSHATVAAYRDTFRLLLEFLQRNRRRSHAPAPIDVLTAEVVLKFLDHLEKRRRNRVSTRNARLAAIRSFVHYLDDWLGIDLATDTRRILAIPLKRYPKPMVGYLRRGEIEAILAATDDSWTGRRDHLMFLLLYNTGARISEILSLRVVDFLAFDGRQVQLHGKGRKHRTIPLWPKTRQCIRRWIKENHFSPEAPLADDNYYSH